MTERCWTEQEEASVMVLSEQGMTINGIASMLGRSYHSVHSRRKRLKQGIKAVARKLWTAEEDEKIREWWAQGKTYADIAGELGLTIGSVAGHAHRMGLRDSMRAKKEPAKRSNPGVYKPWSERKHYYQKKLVPMAPELDSRNLPLAELENNECRYPVTDDAPFLFCGQPQAEGSSYCAHHHHLCWTPPRAREREARPR
jgi:GcrA cell cycle regulator